MAEEGIDSITVVEGADGSTTTIIEGEDGTVVTNVEMGE